MSEIGLTQDDSNSEEETFLDGLVGVVAFSSGTDQALIFEFDRDVAQAQIQISSLGSATYSLADGFGSWLAIDGDGEAIASGLLLEPLGTLSGDALAFDFNLGQPFSSLVISSLQDQFDLAQAHASGYVQVSVQTISIGQDSAVAAATAVNPAQGAFEVRVSDLVFGLDSSEIESDGDQTGADAEIVSAESTVQFAAAALQSESDPDGYVRPFADDAPWNVAVSGLERHAESDRYADLLWSDAPDRPGNFNIGNDGYTYPVYEANADTPWFQVSSDNPSWGNLHGEWIPFDPAWQPAAGSDGQIIILDPASGREWDLWQVDFDGSIVNIGNGNLTAGDYRSNDYLEPEDWTPGSRGVGIPYLAMLVRPEEIAQGVIEHALSMPIRNTSGEEYLPPATKLEHPENGPGIPEGMRFALDVTDAEIDAWAAGLPAGSQDAARIIAVAMRDYGWFITDTAGAATIQLEDVTTAGDEWDALGLGNPRDLLDGLMQPDRIYALVASDQYPAQQ